MVLLILLQLLPGLAKLKKRPYRTARSEHARAGSSQLLPNF